MVFFFEIWSKLGNFIVWFGLVLFYMVWLVLRAQIPQQSVGRSVGRSVTRVGIELLGQLKKKNLKMSALESTFS